MNNDSNDIYEGRMFYAFGKRMFVPYKCDGQALKFELDQVLILGQLSDFKMEIQMPSEKDDNRRIYSREILLIFTKGKTRFALKLIFGSDRYSLIQTYLFSPDMSVKKIFKKKFYNRSYVEAKKPEKLINPIRCAKEALTFL